MYREDWGGDISRLIAENLIDREGVVNGEGFLAGVAAADAGIGHV